MEDLTPSTQSLLTRFLHTTAQTNAGDLLDASFRAALERLDRGIFRVVLVGEVKRGKSSLANALLGERLLPTADKIATACVFKVIYGDQPSFRVFFNDERMPPLDVSAGDVPTYAVQGGDHLERVDFVGVECPSELLKDGFALVDTPGLGGIHRWHSALTWKYAPRADAVIFVLDARQQITTDEKKSLKRLQEITPLLTVVQTHNNTRGAAAADAMARKNREEASDALGLSHRDRAAFERMFFQVDSADYFSCVEAGQDPFESGIPAVREFLRKCFATSRRILETQLLIVVRDHLRLLQDRLRFEIKVLHTTDEKKLDGLRRGAADENARDLQGLVVCTSQFESVFSLTYQQHLARLEAALATRSFHERLGALTRANMHDLVSGIFREIEETGSSQLNTACRALNEAVLSQLTEELRPLLRADEQRPGSVALPLTIQSQFPGFAERVKRAATQAARESTDWRALGLLAAAVFPGVAPYAGAIAIAAALYRFCRDFPADAPGEIQAKVREELLRCQLEHRARVMTEFRSYAGALKSRIHGALLGARERIERERSLRLQVLSRAAAAEGLSTVALLESRLGDVELLLADIAVELSRTEPAVADRVDAEC